MPETKKTQKTQTPEPADAEAPRDKPRREPLTRDRIVRAGLRLMDEEGLEAVSMRHVGRELGVEAMSLYNHVKDKDDLLDCIIELAMGEFEVSPPSGDWAEEIRTAAHAWRRLLTAHPKVMTLLVERNHPLTSIQAMRPIEIALDILRRAGLAERDAVQAFRSFGGFIFGYVMMEVGNMVAGVGEDAQMVGIEALRAMLPADELPRFVELLPELTACDSDADFEFGLSLLIAGLRAKIQAG